MSVRWILLPGLDGLGRFRSFRETLAGRWDCRALSYPPDLPLGYDALTERVREEVRQEADYILVAESFSGPIAIRIAAERPPGLRALVLAASFCHSPASAIAGAALRRLAAPLSRLRPSAFLVKLLLLGAGAPQALVDDVQEAAAHVHPETLALRLREVSTVDVCASLSDVRVPLLYLQAMRDRLIGEQAVHRLRASCPGIQVRPIDAPHMLLQREPVAAMEAVAEFLRRHEIS